MGFPESEVSVTLVGDAEIAELGGRYGRPAKATDVLAFAQRDAAEKESAGPLLGDVVISLETAGRQARRRRVPLDRELRALLVHGLLHLLGMDHRNLQETRAMRALERHVEWEIARLA